MRRDIAALDKNLLAQRDPNRISRLRFLRRRRIPALNRRNALDLFAGEKTRLSPTLSDAGFDATGNDAPFVEAINILHAKTQRQIARRFRRFQLIERVRARRPVVPFHFFTALSRDVLALLSPKRERNTRASNPSCCKKRAIFRFDFAKTLFAVIGQIHLVHDDNDLPNA